MSADQQARVIDLLKGIIAGAAPLACIELNESYLNSRAKAEKSTLSIPGIAAFEEATVRARAARRVS